MVVVIHTYLFSILCLYDVVSMIFRLLLARISHYRNNNTKSHNFCETQGEANRMMCNDMILH